MSVSLPRIPAWSGFAPKDRFLLELDAEAVQALDALFGSKASWQRFSDSEVAPSGMEGYYLARDGRDEWFVKLVPETYREQFLETEAVASELKRRGIRCVTAVKGFPKSDGHRMMIAYPYYSHRFSDFSEDDLTALGQASAVLHRALKTLPGHGTIAEKTHRREWMIKEHLLQMESSDALVREAIGEHYLRLDRAADAQVIHGDLNVGNVMYVDEKPFFLDFEDTVHAFYTPLFDVAFMFERFILIPHEDDHKTAALARIFFKSYMEESKTPLFAQKGDLFKTLVTLSLRALALLSMQRERGVGIAPGEWQKFHLLIGHLYGNRTLIDAVEAEWL